MLFSVIIPTYNRLDFLKECLDSVWAQSFEDYELIVIDDGSTDGTDEYLKTLGHRIVHLSQSNAGPGVARNFGASVSKGRFLAFIDSDDRWFTWTLQTFSQVIKMQPDVKYITGKNVYFGHDNNPVIEHKTFDFALFKCYFEASLIHDVPTPLHSSVCNTQTFHSVGGFGNQAVGEDVHLWLKLGTASNFVWIQSPELCTQRRHGSSISRDLDKQIEGFHRLLSSEKNDEFPGGREYRFARDKRLSAGARSISMACLKAADFRSASSLYLKTFTMNCRQRRVRYLAFFPAYAAFHAVREGLKMFGVRWRKT